MDQLDIEKAIQEDKDNLQEYIQLLESKANPFSPFESQIDTLVNDPQFYALSTLADRKTAFYEWAPQKTQVSKSNQTDEQRFHQFVIAKKKPNQSFIEFKRKYKQSSEYLACKIPESSRELIFRDVVSR